MRNKFFTLFIVAFAIGFFVSSDIDINISNSQCSVDIKMAHAGVDACYTSSEFNDNGPYTIIYGEECYENGVACGKNQGCEQGTGFEQYCYEYIC